MELLKEFSPLEMIFKPTIPAPKAVKGKLKFIPHRWHYSELEKVTDEVLSKDFTQPVNVYKEVRNNLFIFTMNLY